jgi:hypothetical protein
MMTHRFVGLTIPCFVLLLAAPGAPAADEIRGAAILDHPCGKTIVRFMGLVHAGKIDESQKLGTQEMNDDWVKRSAEEREMFGKIMQKLAKSEKEFAEDIRAHGVLEIAGAKGTLTVAKEVEDEKGKRTETDRWHFAIDGKSCLCAPKPARGSARNGDP